MANHHPKCEICSQRHRPGNCTVGGGGVGAGPAQVNQCYSLPGVVATLARICGELAALIGKLPCVKATMAG